MDGEFFYEVFEFSLMLTLAGLIFFVVRWVPYNEKIWSKWDIPPDERKYASPGWILEALSPYILGIGILGSVVGGIGLLIDRFQ